MKINPFFMVLILCAGFFTACKQNLVAADYKFGIAGRAEQGLAAADVGESSGCSAGASACAPDDLGGRIFSGGAMWGELGPEAYNLTMIGATPEVILNPSTGKGGSLSFSLLEGTTLSSEFWAPEATAPEKSISRMEFNFDYVDATIELKAGTPVDGRYIVRTVFVSDARAPDVEGTMKRGDLLLRQPNDLKFLWCGGNGCLPDREQVTDRIVDSSLVSYIYPGQGNPDYVPFVVPLSNSLKLSGEQLNTPSQVWKLDFDMTGSVQLRQPPEDIVDLPSLMRAFQLSWSDGTSMGTPPTRTIAVSLNLVSKP